MTAAASNQADDPKLENATKPALSRHVPPFTVTNERSIKFSPSSLSLGVTGSIEHRKGCAVVLSSEAAEL